jgi:hypothetical protein
VKKHKNNDRQKAFVGVYLLIMAVAATNWLFPSSDYPLNFNFYQQQSYFWTLVIPPNATKSILTTLLNETAVINVTVSADQPMADGVPVNISALGCVRAAGNFTADKFIVGFDGAYDPKHRGTVYNGYTVEAWSFIYLKPPTTWPNNCPSSLGPNAVHFLGESYDTVFYFPNPGTYPVSVKASYWPNFIGTPVTYNFTDNVVDIQSSASLSAGVVSRAEALAVIATIPFSLFELYPPLKKYLQ